MILQSEKHRFILAELLAVPSPVARADLVRGMRECDWGRCGRSINGLVRRLWITAVGDVYQLTSAGRKIARIAFLENADG